mgnify:CR=1 FL=1
MNHGVVPTFSKRTIFALGFVATLLITFVFHWELAVPASAESVSSTLNVSTGNSRGIAISNDGAFAYVTTEIDNALIKVDLTTFTVVSSIPVGNEPYGVTLTSDGNYALVANFSSSTISKVKLSDESITTISLAGNPQNIAIDSTDSFAYVSLFYQNKIAKINLSTNSVTAQLTVGQGPRGIAIDPSGTYLFTANDGSGTSSKVSLSNFSLASNIRVGNNPYGATIDSLGNFAYISNLNSRTISKINISTSTVVATIAVLGTPWATAMVPGTNFAYVSDSNGTSVYKLNLSTNQVISTVQIGNNPRGLVVNPTGTALYVTNYGEGNIQKIPVFAENQSISFASQDPSLLSGNTYQFSVNSTSGLTAVLSSSTPSVCSTSNQTFTVLNRGLCVLLANQSGGSGWAAATQISRQFSDPSASTDPVTAITSDSATLHATINSGELSTTASFTYSQSPTLATGNNTVTLTALTASTNNETRNAVITGLTPHTTYYYQVTATNSINTTTSSIASFTTRGSDPSASTDPVTAITSDSATLHATINSGELSTTASFTYSQSPTLATGNNTVTLTALTASTNNETRNAVITGLMEDTTYYVRVTATNSLGSSSGEIISFRTRPPLGMSINDGDLYTNSTQVQINLEGPNDAVAALVSNDGGFKNQIQTGLGRITWKLDSAGDERLPKVVYVKFILGNGSRTSVITDDIILDTTAPSLTDGSGTATNAPDDAVLAQSLRFNFAPKNGAKLKIKGSDRNSGVSSIEIRTSSRGKPVFVSVSSSKASQFSVLVRTKSKKLYIRLKDKAGNFSKSKTITVK